MVILALGIVREEPLGALETFDNASRNVLRPSNGVLIECHRQMALLAASLISRVRQSRECLWERLTAPCFNAGRVMFPDNGFRNCSALGGEHALREICPIGSR